MTLLAWWRLRTKVTREAVLRTLASGPKFGLEVNDEIDPALAGSFWHLRAYVILRALEREGIVQSFEVDAALAVRGGRPRRYYKIVEGS